MSGFDELSSDRGLALGEKPKRRRKRSPRFVEIAAAAGVSVATVDRVLNERDSVSAATRARVLAAAGNLNIPRILPQPGHGVIHLGILLPRNTSPFFQRLAAALRDVSAMLDRRVVVHRTTLAETDVAGVAAALRNPPHPRAGFVIAAPDQPVIRAAVEEAIARGEHGVAVVSELPGIAGVSYVGIDNRRAGRAAGHLMGRMTPGPGRIVMLGSSPDFRAHHERHRGFLEALAEFPHLVPLAADLRTGDNADRCYEAVRRALAVPQPPIAGIYNSGAGADGVAAALHGYKGPRPNWIGHEISADHVSYLNAGLMDVAIDQDPSGQAVAALQTLLHQAAVTDLPPAMRRGELRIYTRHSLP